MKEMKIEEMLKEMEKYGWTEERIKDWYEDTDKSITFEEYIKNFYESDYYMPIELEGEVF